MRINKVSFKNFGSYGNRMMTLEIPEVPSFFLVHGKNGNGKSTLSDVIKFAIFGKLENKSLKDMANRLNKNAYVKIELATKRGKVEIERGIEPGLFKVYIDGTEFDKAGKRSVQQFLEEEILEMPFYVFANTLSLSINDFKSFLKMSPHDKRSIIDKIFGLQILSQMRELLKHQTKRLKDSVIDITSTIEAFKRSLDSSVNELQLLETKIEESSSIKKTQLEESQLLYTSNIQKGLANLQKITDKHDEIQIRKKQVADSLSGDKQLVISSREKIALYKNSKCPVCESDLTSNFHQEILKHYQEAEQEAMDRIASKNESISKLNENYSKIDNLKNETRVNINSLKVKLSYVEQELNKLGTPSDHQTASLQNMVDDFKKKIDENAIEQAKNQKMISYYGLVEEILGEKGVKQMAIKSILPSLNTELARLIKIMGIEHRIVFNEEFDAKITHLGIEVSPESLSNGESTKVDFSVLLAIVKLMKMKFPTMNMMFLDEIFSALDADGQHHVTRILKDIVKEYKMNIFVISHFPLSFTEFDYKIEILKNSGFSTFNIESVI